MTTDDTIEKRLEESKRRREDNRQKLEDTDQLVERINNKIDQAEKSRQNRKKPLP